MQQEDLKISKPKKTNSDDLQLTGFKKINKKQPSISLKDSCEELPQQATADVNANTYEELQKSIVDWDKQ
jgi:hypothetical protein